VGGIAYFLQIYYFLFKFQKKYIKKVLIVAFLFFFVIFIYVNEYIKHNKATYLLNYHAIWCPRYRRKLLVGDLKEKLNEIIEEVTFEKQCKILALEIMPDHVHLSVSMPPKLAPYKLIKAIKGRSSNILRKQFPYLLKMPTLWTRSYFVTTTGAVSTKKVIKYINEQWKK